MTEIQIDGAILEASESEDLVRSGLLVPYGVECRSSIGRFTVGPGVFTIPADTSTAVVNLRHDRTQPVAVFASLHEEPRGIVGRLKFANTPEGRQAFADSDPKAGSLRSLSVEARGVLVKAGAATAGAIFGGALVPQPAFAGADLYAAADTTDETVTAPDGTEVPAHTETTDTHTDTASDGSEQTWEDTTTTDVETLPDGTVKTTRTTVSVTTVTPPADPTNTDDTTTTQGDQMTATPAVPATLTATHTDTNTAPAKVGPTLAELNVLLASAHALRDPAAIAALQEAGSAGADLYAALTDIKGSGVSAMIQPQWVGEAYNKATYDRRYVPLFAHADLTSFSVNGYKWTTPPVMGEWGADKTAVPSAAVAVSPTSHDAKNWAGAHDVDRRLRDFGTPEFWDGYWRHMSNSYNKLTDADALDTVANAATPIVAGATPAGVSRAAAAIVDGYLAVQDEGVPTFAVLAADLWRSLLLTPKDQTLEYLSVALSLDEASVQSFRIIPARTVDLDAGTALVGIGQAATVYELPGSPLRVEGLDMVKGGIDPGAFGYSVTTVDDAAAFALVSQPAG